MNQATDSLRVSARVPILGSNQTQSNQKKNKFIKNRNDHSIQKKSPIKLPQSHRKNELTFRNNQSGAQKSNEHISVSRMSLTSKKSCISQNPHQKQSISIQEYELIDHLWQTTIQLGNFNNPMFHKFISQLQTTIREMIKSFAYSKMDEELTAMVSSQKIKLQNFLLSSHYDHTHKQYEIGESDINIPEQIPITNCSEVKIKDKNSIRSNTTSEGQITSSKKASPKESTQELQFKKILYMIDGKNKGIANSRKPKQHTSSAKKQNNNFYLESLSSFNQNPSEDSGYTIMQIDKENDNIDSNYIDQKELSQSLMSGQSTISQKQKWNEGSSKHKVLQDIIGMLNRKYNKNIQLC